MDVKERLKKCLEHHPEVVAAYLFGSASEDAPVRNDLDILVLLRDGVDRFEAHVNLKCSLAEVACTPGRRIDLLFFDLNEARPHVLVRAVNGGVLIKNMDPRFLSERIDELSKYFLENEPVIRRAEILKKERLEAFGGTG